MLPKNIKPDKPFKCFGNCQRAVAGSDLTYCEGFAIHLGSPVLQHHAWLCADDGYVIDPTWTGNPDTPGLGAEYFGVPFNKKFVLTRVLRSKEYSAILDDEEFSKGETSAVEFLFSIA